jgi:hypothetical protein
MGKSVERKAWSVNSEGRGEKKSGEWRVEIGRENWEES